MLVMPDSAPMVSSPPGSSPRGPGAACPNSPSEERLLTDVPGVGPGQLHRSLAHKNSTLSLVPCCPHLQIFNRFFIVCWAHKLCISLGLVYTVLAGQGHFSKSSWDSFDAAG